VKTFLKQALLPGTFILSVTVAGAGYAHAQKVAGEKSAADPKQVTTTNPGSSSAAYAELVLKRTEVRSDVESLSLEYTEEYPKLKELRFVLTLFDRDLARIGKVKPADSSKLTLALGKLMLRSIEIETDLWNLQKNYKEEHPDVRRAKRKLEIYDSAIDEILN
jgi:hypothetical protein